MIYCGLLISCTTTCYVFFRILDYLYCAKFPKRVIYYVGPTITYILLNFAIGLMEIPILNTIYTLVSFYIISIFFYVTNRKDALIKAIIIVGYMAIVDFMTTLIFAVFMKKSIYNILLNDYSYFVTAVVNSIIMLYTFRMVCEKLKKIQLNKSLKYLHIFMAFLLFFELYFLLYGIYSLKNSSNNFFLIFSGLGFIILDLGVIHLYDITVDNYKLEENNRLLEQQKEWISKYYDGFEKQYEKIQKISHDINKHLKVINSMNENEIGEKQEYIVNLIKNIEESQTFKCSDKILCLILWDKIQICKSNNISIEVNMEDLKFDFMEKIDITSLFSNLLDNAIESCLKCEEGNRKIDLRIHKYKQYIAIKLINTMKETPIEKNGKFISRKRKHLGVGVEIIRDLADKYCGNYKCNYSKSIFEACVILSVSNKLDCN